MTATHSATAQGIVARPPDGVPLPKDYVPLAESHHALYQVTTEAFQGPLDLLLFLIRRHQLDIFDIPMAFVCARYLEVLEQTHGSCLDVAAEFMYMASELLHIKSRMLLPKEPSGEDDTDLGDPRADLVSRLLLLQSYQDAAQDFEQRPQLGRDIFANEPEALPVGLKPLRALDPLQLIATFDRLLKKRAPEARHQVIVEQVPMRLRMGRLLERLDERGAPLSWTDVFSEVDGRLDLIVMFLAVLELAKQRLLQIAEDNAGELVLLGQFSSLSDAHQRLAGTDIEAAFA